MVKILYRDTRNVLRETQVYEPKDYLITAQGTTGAMRPVITNAQGMIDPSLVGAVPASMLQITKTADQTIVAGDCVYALNADRVRLATQDKTYKEALVLGVALGAAYTNQPVTFAVMGIVTLDIFNVFLVNDILYLDHDGGLTNERPKTGYLVPVGIALGNGSVMVQIGYPSKLGDV